MAIQDAMPQAPAHTGAEPAPAPPREPSTGELLKGIVDDASRLVRQELLLARQEVAEGAVARAKAGAALGVAGVLGLYGLGFALLTVAIAIGGPPWLGFLLVTVALLLVAGVLAWFGARRLAASKLAPERARAELKETAAELKEEIRWVRPQARQPRS